MRLGLLSSRPTGTLDTSLEDVVEGATFIAYEEQGQQKGKLIPLERTGRLNRGPVFESDEAVEDGGIVF